MSQFKIGVLCDSFRLSVTDNVRKAAEVGAEGIQVYSVKGEMAPENMDAGARKDFKKLCADVGLVISALCGDMGGGFRSAADNPQKVERSKSIVDLAVDLGTSVVTTHIGVVPEDSGSETYKTMLSACREISEYAAEKGVTFAVETGPEKAVTLKGFLDEVGSFARDRGGIGVNLDPANLVMVVADDPVAAARTFGDYVVHTHAKDGVQLKPGAAGERAKFNEVPLGEGGVPWDEYLAALREIGYSGFLTIEREVGDDPAADIAQAVRFLREKIG